MADKQESRFSKWLEKFVYTLIVMHHTEDYLGEDANGNVKIIPANEWRNQAMKDCRTR